MTSRPPWEPRHYRKYILIGLIVVAVGGLECRDALNTFQTGIPVYTLRHHVMDWQDSLGAGVLSIAFGLLVVAVGFGWVRPRGVAPRRPSSKS